MEDNALFFVIGMFAFSITLMNVVMYKRILRPVFSLEKKGYKVTGTLLRVDRVRKSKSVAYYAVVKYKTLSGGQYEGRSVLSIRKFLKEKEVPMEIIYNPEKEEEFMPVDFFNPKLYKRMLVLVNVFTLGMLVFVLFQMNILKI